MHVAHHGDDCFVGFGNELVNVERYPTAANMLSARKRGVGEG
jgi:hypothetical protein